MKRFFPKEEQQKYLQPIELKALRARTRTYFLKHGRARVGRNHPCPCGSGKRFKNCCYRS